MDRPSALTLAHPQPVPRAPHLVVVDDDRAVLDTIERFARPLGFEVAAFESAPEALAATASRPADVALVDLRLPGVGGLDMLREIKRRTPRCAVVMMTGFGTIEGAVEAIKLGATDYLRKPIDFSRLKDMLGELGVQSARHRAAVALDADVPGHAMIGRSPAMLDLFGMIRRVGPHFSTALISGETGTGKELVARALHATSKRHQRPFVTLNCSAIVETLFESELFGHTRGAFTGATDAREGLFERARAGVLFLDEIGELTPSVQAKLLRVLETGEITRVGSSDPQRTDVRIIAATNRVLEREVQAGRFRSDLYFRLHVVELTVPPLRERREDIPLLARAFAQEFAAEFDKPICGLTPDAERSLAAHEWPGNVRELKNVIGRACMLTEREWIDAPDLAVGAALLLQPCHGPVRPMQEVEREQVVRALEETRGNKKEAARRLGISRRAFYRRLEKYGLYSPQAEAGDEAA